MEYENSIKKLNEGLTRNNEEKIKTVFDYFAEKNYFSNILLLLFNKLINIFLFWKINPYKYILLRKHIKCLFPLWKAQ